MSDPKLPKNRIIEKAKEFAKGDAKAESKRLATLMTAIAKDEAYWLWINDALFDSFTWASEAMVAKLNKAEITSLRRHIEKGDLYLVRFDDPKAYQAIISEALSYDIHIIAKALVSALRSLEENTACVLKFTKDGPIASGYPHGIPLVCYFTTEGCCFVAYIEDEGSNKVYDSSAAIPLHEEHIIKRIAQAIESYEDDFSKTRDLSGLLKSSKERLDNLQKFGMTLLK